MINTNDSQAADERQAETFEFVVSHDTAHSSAGYTVYSADILALGDSVGARTLVDHVEVTLAPATPVDLFTAAAVAAEQLALRGFRVLDEITSYGSHGRGQMERAA